MPDTGPIDLDALLARGAVLRGSPVVRLVAVTLDGFSLTLDGVATPAPVEPAGPDAGASDREFADRILDALAKLPIAVTREQLAQTRGYKTAKGRFATRIKAMAAAGQLIERNGLLADDAAKFPPGGDDD